MAALAVAPLAPFLLDALHLSRGQVGLFLPAVYLGGVLMALPAGWLTDRLGVRLTLGLGQALTGLMVVAAAAGGSLGIMLAALVVAGFGFSVANPATGRAVIEWFAPRQRGLAMGIKQTGLTLGGIVGAVSLPVVAATHGWREALAAAGVVALVSGLVVAVLYREPAVRPVETGGGRPRLAEVAPLLARPGVVVVFACGFLLSLAQSSLLAYLALFARETFALSAVGAGQLLGVAQMGGTLARLGWGYVSDRYLGGRRRPGVVVNAIAGAAAYAVFAAGPLVPGPLLPVLALVAGAGAFGWVGLYFALVAEIGGARYAGLLTGIAVVAAWSGVLVGPVMFGAVLDMAGGYALAWLALVAIALAAASALARLRPLVQRSPAS